MLVMKVMITKKLLKILLIEKKVMYITMMKTSMITFMMKIAITTMNKLQKMHHMDMRDIFMTITKMI